MQITNISSFFCEIYEMFFLKFHIAYITGISVEFFYAQKYENR